MADPVGHLPEMLVLAAPWFRMAVVFLKTSALLFLLAAVSSACAQQQPPVKVNVLGVETVLVLSGCVTSIASAGIAYGTSANELLTDVIPKRPRVFS